MMIDTTCTDCTREIRISDSEMTFSKRKARLCSQCIHLRRVDGKNLEDLQPHSTGYGNYRVMVELQWAITPKDLLYRAEGDVEMDFAQRSLDTVRSALELVAGRSRQPRRDPTRSCPRSGGS